MSDDLVQDLLARVEALERRTTGPTAVGSEGDFWALDGVKERLAEVPAGGVVFAGRVDLPGGSAEWQFGRPTEFLTDLDPEAETTAADRLAALGSPVRLRLLQAVLAGVTGTADLRTLPDLGTSGQVYHHLRALTAAGWLRSAGRGRVGVPADRVVPLLTILAATLG